MNSTHRDDDVMAWAGQLGFGSTMFKNLPVGARFTFKKDDAGKPHCILIREKHGYRHAVGGRLWKTGARTLCHPINEGDDQP